MLFHEIKYSEHYPAEEKTAQSPAQCKDISLIIGLCGIAVAVMIHERCHYQDRVPQHGVCERSQQERFQIEIFVFGLIHIYTSLKLLSSSRYHILKDVEFTDAMESPIMLVLSGSSI